MLASRQWASARVSLNRGELAIRPVAVVLDQGEHLLHAPRAFPIGEREPAPGGPDPAIDDLIWIRASRGETVLTVQRYVTAAVVGIGLATLATMALVFLLSFQVRRREIATMVKLGCSRGRLAAILAAEVAGVLVAGIVLAGGTTAFLWSFGEGVVRMLVRMS